MNAIIHCKANIFMADAVNHPYITVIDNIKDYGEVDLIVEDIPYEIVDGTYQDPDEQLCEFYEIDYNLVNCIEAAWRGGSNPSSMSRHYCLIIHLQQTNMQTIKTQSLKDSEAINALSVDKDALTAQVEFKGGERYTYRNVALRAIQQLLDNPSQSIGAWVNNNLVDGDTTSFVYGYELA